MSIFMKLTIKTLMARLIKALIEMPITIILGTTRTHPLLWTVPHRNVAGTYSRNKFRLYCRTG